jgi:hypothetical protein
MKPIWPAPYWRQNHPEYRYQFHLDRMVRWPDLYDCHDMEFP